MRKLSWIGVDLDNTLAKYTKYKGPGSIGAPIPEVAGKVKELLADGKDVRIFTARAHKDDNGEARRAIKKWCKEHLGKALKVTNRKDPDMEVLVDDRSVHPDKIDELKEAYYRGLQKAAQLEEVPRSWLERLRFPHGRTGKHVRMPENPAGGYTNQPSATAHNVASPPTSYNVRGVSPENEHLISPALREAQSRPPDPAQVAAREEYDRMRTKEHRARLDQREANRNARMQAIGSHVADTESGYNRWFRTPFMLGMSAPVSIALQSGALGAKGLYWTGKALKYPMKARKALPYAASLPTAYTTARDVYRAAGRASEATGISRRQMASDVARLAWASRRSNNDPVARAVLGEITGRAGSALSRDGELPSSPHVFISPPAAALATTSDIAGGLMERGKGSMRNYINSRTPQQIASELYDSESVRRIGELIRRDPQLLQRIQQYSAVTGRELLTPEVLAQLAPYAGHASTAALYYRTGRRAQQAAQALTSSRREQPQDLE